MPTLSSFLYNRITPPNVLGFEQPLSPPSLSLLPLLCRTSVNMWHVLISICCVFHLNSSNVLGSKSSKELKWGWKKRWENKNSEIQKEKKREMTKDEISFGTCGSRKKDYCGFCCQHNFKEKKKLIFVHCFHLHFFSSQFFSSKINWHSKMVWQVLILTVAFFILYF